MGQVLSNIRNIWRCIHSDSKGHDQLSNSEQQSHYITIPDPVRDGDDMTWRAPETPELEGDDQLSYYITSPDGYSEVVLAQPFCSTIQRIGPYNSHQSILLVGEGDFSFSASLAVAFGNASNIIATSLNSQEYLIKNYRKFLNNKMKLETRGCMVIHGVDATNIVQHSLLGNLRFDCIIYNFPHTGSFGRTDSDLRKNRELVTGFLRNAKKMVNENGEIHITHKSNGFFRGWDIPKIGCGQGLYLTREIRFNRKLYCGYHTKFGFTGDKNFHCSPSKTYVFATHPK